MTPAELNHAAQSVAPSPVPASAPRDTKPAAGPSRLEPLARFLVGINNALRTHAFVERPMTVGVDGWLHAVWTRRWGWKLDRIRVSASFKHDDVIATVSVVVPMSRSNPDSTAAGLLEPTVVSSDLVRIARRTTRGYRLRGGLLTWTTPAKRLVSDMSPALAWLERTDTPAKCLTSHDRASDSTQDARVRAYVHGYLMGLPPELDGVACQFPKPGGDHFYSA